MNGMYCMEWYFGLSEKEPQTFEGWLTRWARKREANEIMLFDKSTIKAGQIKKVEGTNCVYILELPGTSVEFINFYGEMCILSKIIVNTPKKGDEIIYKIPDRWNGCHPWFAQ